MANPVVQWQIVAADPELVTKFYSGLFGWTVQRDNSLGYRELKSNSGRGIDGGVWPSPPGGHTMVQLFVEVEDMDASIASAIALGARVLIPKAFLPDGDTMAILLDPAGMSFGLMSPKP